MRSFFSCSPAAGTAAIIPKIACLGAALAKTGKSPQPELPLQQSRLHGGSLRTGTGYTGSLPASEGDFINKVFTAVGAAGFPGDDDALSNQPADGSGGVAQEGSGLLHGDTTGCFLLQCFHGTHCSTNGGCVSGKQAQKDGETSRGALSSGRSRG